MKIELQSVSKIFSEGEQQLKVIDHLSYVFPESSSIAIVGASGVGKSTLLNLIGGLERPSSGVVSLDNSDISKLPEEKLAQFRGKNIGFVFQFHHLLPEFTAIENVAMPLWISGSEKNSSLNRAADVLKRVGLENRASHRPGQLSGGEQQRVSIARALVARPNLILADEPTGNLDSVSAELISNLLLELQAETRCSLILVTHSAEMAAKMQHTVVMQPGGQLQPKHSN